MMRFFGIDPWRQMRRLRSEMDRVFAEIDRPRAAVFPPVNVYTSKDGLLVTAELPGVDPEDLEISAMRESLTIRGERRSPEATESTTWHRRERRGGKFSRTIELPFTIDTESVDASCNDGVLRIGLRRPEEDKPKKIEVQVS